MRQRAHDNRYAAGLAFAARHAECVFVSGPNAAVIGPRVARLREAAARHEDYKSYIDHKGALTLLSGWAGIDDAGYAMDQKINYIENDAGRAALENFTKADPSRAWTVGEVAEHVAIGGMGPVFTGSPAAVADQMRDFIARTGVNGFNLAYAVLPETCESIVDYLVPELQARGLYKTAYAPGTLRENLFRAGPGLPPITPAEPEA
jgi:alkanesulfonate monooxygenase